MTTPPSGTAGVIAYGVALAVHVVSAVVGFGMLGLSGLYGGWGRHPDTSQARRDLRQYFGRANRAGRALWAVPISGGIALWLHDGAGALGQGWVLAATACWALATVLAVRVIWPGERRIRPLVAGLETGPPGAPPGTAPADAAGGELAALCRPIVRAAAWCDGAFVVALALMVLQPGK